MGLEATMGLLLLVVRFLPVEQGFSIAALRHDGNAGTYWAMVRDRAEGVRWYLHPSEYFSAFREESSFDGMFCMFLLGFYAGRRAIFQNIACHRDLLRQILWIPLGIALPLNALQVGFHAQISETLLGAAMYVVGRPAGCVFYVSGLLFLIESGFASRLFACLAPAGRRGLINYLLQSLMFSDTTRPVVKGET
jgi:uncharacterized membrane protein YeiB